MSTNPAAVPRYETTDVAVAGAVYRIEFFAPVIAEINALSRERLARVVWLTTWNDEARTVLAPAVGLDEFEVCPQPRDLQSRGWVSHPRRGEIWWKTGRVLEHIAGQPGTPYVWTDDLLDRDVKRALRADTRSHGLLPTTMATPGLTLTNLQRVRAFLGGRG